MNQKVILKYDKSSMFSKILEWPSQLCQGWEIGDSMEPGIRFRKIKNIVFNGMGGSAIAGDVIRSLLGEHLPVPFVVNRGYYLPPFADKETLFIASSYSGNTEETLSATQQAIQKGCKLVAVTSGGKLAEIAHEKHCPVYFLPSGYPPRASLGYSLGVLLAFFSKLGVGPFSKKHVEQAATFLEKEGKGLADPARKENPVWSVAKQLKGRFPLLYAGTETLEPVGFRWKCQFNENSKMHAAYIGIPEMNHNEIVAWKKLEAVNGFYSSLVAVFLRSQKDSPRIRLRMELTRELVLKNRGKAIEVTGKGSSFLEEMLYLIYFGDLVSVFLAGLNKVDPTEIENINYLKLHLSKTK